MKKEALFIIVFYFVFYSANLFSQTQAWEYLGQIPPSEKSVIFAEDIVSKKNIHSRLVVSPDGKDIFWNTVDMSTFSTQIQHIGYQNGKWSQSAAPSFAQKGITANPMFSPDGKKLFFDYRSSLNAVWTTKYVERINDSTWSAPKNDGFLMNTSSSFTKNGKVYFSDYKKGKIWETGIYSALLTDVGYSNKQILDPVVNSQFIDYTPFISPDEKYLLFSSSRPTVKEDMYLNISFRTNDGKWTTPQKINDAIGFTGNARFPVVSPDGKYLFFCGDDGNFYWVGINAILNLKPTNVDEGEIPPSTINLYQNYPNPFNPTTTIEFAVSKTGRYKLGLYNTLGELVKEISDKEYEAGYYKETFNAAGLSSGMYIYRLSGNDANIVRKMVVLR